MTEQVSTHSKITDLCMLNHCSIQGIHCTWSWYMILLTFCWIGFASILLRIFVSQFVINIVMELSFLVVFFWLSCVKVMLASLKWGWECSLLFSFMEEFEKDWGSFFSKCLIETASETIQSWTFLNWRFWSHDPMKKESHYWFSVSLWCILASCMFLGINPFSWIFKQSHFLWVSDNNS